MARWQVIGLVAAALLVVLWVLTQVQPDVQPLVPAQSAAGPAIVPNEVYDPVRAGEEMPRGYRQLLARDAIRPVYEPRFVPAAEAGWDPPAMVIGVEIDGEAKAYPVSFLNRREMVIDRLSGVPILVTW